MVFSYILFLQQTADVTRTYLRNWSKQQPCRLRKWHEKTLQHALQHYKMKAFEGLSLTNGLSYISQGKTSCENTQFLQHTVWQLCLTRTDQASFPYHAALHYRGYTAQTSEVKLVILWMKHLSLICWMLNIWIKKSHGHAFTLFKWKRDLNVNLVRQLHIFIWFTWFSQQRLEEKKICLLGMPTSVTFSD